MSKKKPTIYHRAKRTPIVVINAYAGGLLYSAKLHGNSVIAALEDRGYGMPIQMANFPMIDHRPVVDDWPDYDLSDAFVISGTRQNYQRIMGLVYALGRRAKVVAAESTVQGANTDDEAFRFLADYHHYHRYTLKVNAVIFGVPQWRERVWSIFVRQDQGDHFSVRQEPIKFTLADVLDDTCTVEKKLVRPTSKYQQLHGDFAPTLRPRSLFKFNGHAVSAVGYNRLCGYPDAYNFAIFPERQREFLSRSSIPIIGAWMLELVERNINHKHSLNKQDAVVLSPGESVDLRPSRKLWASQTSDR